MTVQLTINGQVLSAAPGQTALEVAHAHGIVIPTLCYHQDLSAVGSCRFCVVEVEGWRTGMAFCT